ncbi:MAG: hypothetical protein LBL95_01665 [Deltaproteobacteria bacterium]|nr:hypothetical protein [Deltaproteobacteria bacterium]
MPEIPQKRLKILGKRNRGPPPATSLGAMAGDVLEALAAMAGDVLEALAAARPGHGPGKRQPGKESPSPRGVRDKRGRGRAVPGQAPEFGQKRPKTTWPLDQGRATFGLLAPGIAACPG